MASQSVVNVVRIIIDIILLIVVAIPSMVFKFGDIQPTQRGFFCDDETIRYPYNEGTISTTALILISGLANLGVIVICESLHYYMVKRRKTEIQTEKVFGLDVHPLLYIICGYIWTLGFGIMFNQGLTDIGKYSVGRLRPHFIDGCKPEGPGLDLINCKVGEYITNFTCTTTNKKVFADLRLSFPSGHASMSAMAMIFLACYIQQRVPRFSHSYLVKHVLQFIAISMAWFCALSRVMDFKHHPTDVLSGSILGTIVGLFVVKYIAKGFRDPYTNGPYRRVGPKTSRTHELQPTSLNTATTDEDTP